MEGRQEGKSSGKPLFKMWGKGTQMGNLPGRRNDLEGVEGDTEGEEDLHHLLPRGTLVARMQEDSGGMGGVEEGQ